LRQLSIQVPFTEEDYTSKNAHDLMEELFGEFKQSYERKKEVIHRIAYPVLQNIHTQRGDTVKNVAIPFNDGKRVITPLVKLQHTMDVEGNNLVDEFEKTAVLSFIDENWKEHLRQMDELRTSVQMATYEQKDPLLIYKFEAFELFDKMLNDVNREVASFLMRAELPSQREASLREAEQQQTDMSNMQTNKAAEQAQSNSYKGASTGRSAQQQAKQPVSVGPKVGRNSPCPCGSGKKYKHCHGKN